MSPQHLDWLPSRVPVQCALILGTSNDKSHIPTECRLKDRKPLMYTVGALNNTDQETISAEYMASYGKTLDTEQLAALIRANKHASATWLHVALDEARMLGNFRTVTQCIRDMPSDMNALISQCIVRIVANDSANRPCARALCLMALDTQPSSVHKLRTLLGNDDMSELQAMFSYVTMMSALQQFVREMSDGSVVARQEHVYKVRVGKRLAILLRMFTHTLWRGIVHFT
jgi:hypothetical protein